MTNLQKQLDDGEFSSIEALLDAVKMVLVFLSVRYDVFSYFDLETDELSAVKDHVSGSNLPPIVFNPREVTKSCDTNLVGSIHCHEGSLRELRERTHDVEKFRNVYSDSEIIVTIDEDLRQELKEMSDKEPTDVSRRLLVCYTAMVYLHELAHYKVARYLMKDVSLQSSSPKKMMFTAIGKPESGFMAEYHILGCILQPRLTAYLPYNAKQTTYGMIDAFMPSSSAIRTITRSLVEHIERILSGDISFADKGPKELEKAASEAIGCPPPSESTPREAAEFLCKSKGVETQTCYANDMPRLSSLPWRRNPKNVTVRDCGGLLVEVSIEDDNDQPLSFFLQAYGNGHANLQTKNSPFGNRCHGSLFSPGYALTRGEHNFALNDLFNLSNHRYRSFLVIVSVGKAQESCTVVV